MVEHKLVPFAAVVALWTLLTLLIKLIRILLKGKNTQYKTKIHTRQKFCHFGRHVAKAKLFCPKCFVQVTRPRVSVHMGKFSSHACHRDLGHQNRDLGNRASPASHMNTSKFLRTKEWRGEFSETEIRLDKALIQTPTVHNCQQ